jgi:hypothetical protein
MLESRSFRFMPGSAIYRMTFLERNNNDDADHSRWRWEEEGVEAGLGAFDVDADSRLEAVERWQSC